MVAPACGRSGGGKGPAGTMTGVILATGRKVLLGASAEDSPGRRSSGEKARRQPPAEPYRRDVGMSGNMHDLTGGVR